MGVFESLGCALAGTGLQGVGGIAYEDYMTVGPGGERGGGPGWVDGVDGCGGDYGLDYGVFPVGVPGLELGFYGGEVGVCGGWWSVDLVCGPPYCFVEWSFGARDLVGVVGWGILV